jgi:hypothetical protein
MQKLAAQSIGPTSMTVVRANVASGAGVARRRLARHKLAQAGPDSLDTQLGLIAVLRRRQCWLRLQRLALNLLFQRSDALAQLADEPISCEPRPVASTARDALDASRHHARNTWS